jgi:hypothetical protein
MPSRGPALPSRLANVPIVAVALFVVLYGVAAALYPGGTRAEPARKGFSFARNYWCDLLDIVTYRGSANPARPVALGAMVVLSIGLSALWLRAPSLFVHAPRRAALVRCAGVASAVTAPFVATVRHDLAVRTSVFLGFAAFATTIGTLEARAGDPLRWLTWLALAAASLNYLVWESGVGLPALPIIQKFAFAAFLGWVIVLARRTASCGRTRRSPPT